MKSKFSDILLTYRMWRAKGLDGVRLWNRERNQNHLHTICRDPAVVYMWWGRDDSALHEELTGRDLILLYLFPWCFPAEDVDQIAAEVEARLKKYPRHRIVFLCNEEHSVKPLTERALEAIFCNQNAFLDESTFRPITEIPKEFDAIYNASMAPYKRHHLAENVESLAMMTYSYADAEKGGYAQEVRRRLSHAAWLKDSRNDDEKLTAGEMVNLYNKARVGLILSEVEGSVFASMEYLLCGLPIVTTPSIGGRSSFWDDRYVIVCDPDSRSVAKAVEELISRDLDPHFVRSETLKRVEEHRDVLRAFLSPHVDSFECPWPPGSHGPFTFFNLHKLGKIIRSGESISLP